MGRSDGERSEGDLLSMLLGKDGSPSAETPSPLAMMQSEPTIAMTSPLPTLSKVKSIGHSSSSNLQQPASMSPQTSPITTRSHYSATKLVEIRLHDPQHTKRIMSNRQSAMRCHEKKTQYVTELEKKEQNLENRNTLLSAKLTAGKIFSNFMDSFDEQTSVRYWL